jgi:probable O-glycosylation ligase (exosortase A-associated)
MRDLVVALLILAAMPLCFRRPFFGLLVFTLLAYMRLQDLTWGFAKYVRWSFYVSLIMFAGFLFSRGEKRLFVPDLRTWIMVALVVIVGLSLAFSRDIDWAADSSRYIEYCKIILIALFTTAVVKHRDHLRMLLLVVALSFGFFGLKGGLQGILTLGRSKIIQGPGGMISDNNDFAMALCMAIPLLLGLGLSERRQVLRRFLLLLVPLTAITVFLTHSRGAFLSLCCASVVLIWRSRNRVAGFTLAGLAIAAVLPFMPAYVERLKTITDYEQEASARGRIDAWRVAGNMIADNPLFGVGFERFQDEYKNYDYRGKDKLDVGTGRKVAHNSYFQIWAECGTPALLLYLTLIALSYWEVWRVRQQARWRYHASWILSWATMFEASLTAFVVGSAFLNRAHFDLFYHLVAIILVFGLVARREMEDETAYPVRSGERGALSVVRPRGFGVRPAFDAFARGGLPRGGR